MQNHRTQKTEFFLKLIGILFILYSFIQLPLIFFGDNYYPKIRRLKEQLSKIDEQNEKLRWQIEEEKKQIINLREDTGAIKNMIRRDFDFIEAEEVVFMVD